MRIYAEIAVLALRSAFCGAVKLTLKLKVPLSAVPANDYTRRRSGLHIAALILTPNERSATWCKRWLIKAKG